MKDAELIMKIDRAGGIHPLDKQYVGLGMKEMTVLHPKSTEFKQLAQYLMDTRGYTHSTNYQIEQIFRIERQGEHDRFEESFPGPPRDRRLLWHGSRATNFGGILSQGLRIAPPEAPVSGYMFGKGIYLADMSSKSANYCCAHISDGTALLLLCEAELGDPMQTLTNASYNAGEDAKKYGMLSTLGQGKTGPIGWTDAAIVHRDLAGVKMVCSLPGVSNTLTFKARSLAPSRIHQCRLGLPAVQRVYRIRRFSGSSSISLPRQDVVIGDSASHNRGILRRMRQGPYTPRLAPYSTAYAMPCALFAVMLNYYLFYNISIRSY